MYKNLIEAKSLIDNSLAEKRATSKRTSFDHGWNLATSEKMSLGTDGSKEPERQVESLVGPFFFGAGVCLFFDMAGLRRMQIASELTKSSCVAALCDLDDWPHEFLTCFLSLFALSG